MVRILFVGLGGCGRHWLKNVYPTQPDVELVGYTDYSPKILAFAQEQVPLPPELAYPSLEEALANVECDAVHIATNLESHIPTAITALKAGKHVLLEKPFAPTIAEAQEAITVADQHGKLLMINQNYRYSRAITTVKKLLRERAVGDIGTIAIDFRKFSNAAAKGNNKHYEIWQPLLVDMSIHHFDQMRYILEQEPREVICKAWNTPWSRFNDPASAQAIITFDQGTVVNYRGSWTSTQQDTGWDGEWRIECSEGTIFFTGRDERGSDQVILHPFGKDPINVPLEPVQFTDWSGSLAAFTDAIHTGIEPGASARQNIPTLALTFAVVEAATTNKPVTL